MVNLSATYVNTYITFVCPIKSPVYKSIECFRTIPAPPLEVQEAVVQVAQQVPKQMRGYVIDSLVRDRVADAQYLLTHVDEFMEIARIAKLSQDPDLDEQQWSNGDL